MKVHEYQAKEVLARYGVPVPRGRVAATADEAAAIAAELGLPVAVKAQIHAGGRGKGGGIKLAATPDEARKAAGEIIGSFWGNYTGATSVLKGLVFGKIAGADAATGR